jgi:hypothetical protein
MNTQVIECCSSVTSVGTYFKMEWVYQDSICRIYRLVSSLSGSPEVMPHLGIVTGALLSVVAKHDLSPNHPMEHKLSSSLLIQLLGVEKGSRSDGTSILFLFPGLGYLFRHSLVRWLKPLCCKHIDHPAPGDYGAKGTLVRTTCSLSGNRVTSFLASNLSAWQKISSSVFSPLFVLLPNSSSWSWPNQKVLKYSTLSCVCG